ncbi:DUF1328 domain-containing protein [Planctomyces sp. SH-PL62]|uniref:DUF1328 domain-containing protein n=1 Tax=Planctomyces sp. SH-PL62 TaxID=1636152 RepID=UPI00078EF3E3|nr:DUF1328 domain-containing protein [Planctomyces sp. SH-PL62]AMV38345.1 hypothetical protein VT85_12985 [Planctomyces sp. SH-PL62]
MLRLAILFAIISMLAAAFGFYGVSDASAGIAKFIALIFAVMFIASLIVGLTVVRKTTA